MVISLKLEHCGGGVAVPVMVHLKVDTWEAVGNIVIVLVAEPEAAMFIPDPVSKVHKPVSPVPGELAEREYVPGQTVMPEPAFAIVVGFT